MPLLSPPLLADITLTGATTAPGSPPHFVMLAMTEAAEASQAIETNLTFPGNIALAQVDVAKGTLDVATIPVISTLLMRRGLSTFRSIGSVQGQVYADRLRAITGFNAGVYHVLTYADTDIEGWEDLRDKKIYIGTENDGSHILVQRLIKLVTGFKAGIDYTAVRMDWEESIASMLSGNVDALIRPGAVPAEFVDRLLASSDRKLRVLGIPSEIAEGKRYQKFSTAPGSLPSFIPEQRYDSERVDVINGGSTIALMMAVIVNREMDHDLVYAMTKKYIASLDDLATVEPWVSSLNLADPFTGLHQQSGLRLHSGARQAWHESGRAVPEHLR